jgi:hypothetical protein
MVFAKRWGYFGVSLDEPKIFVENLDTGSGIFGIIAI